MIQYHDLKEDERLISESEFVKKVISTYDLSDSQIDFLNRPTQKKVESKHIEQIAQFLKDAENLMICGDYDADGVTSTSIAYLLSQSLGKKKIGYYIPHRFNEGYGVSTKTIKLAQEKGYTDVLIVDTGVKAHEAVNFALELGLRVAIVDHHLIEEAPPQVPILHPDYLENYAKKMSAGGLMFLVAEYLDLVTQKILAYAAISTIADVMPLWGKNREIVMRGIIALNKKPLLNIDSLWKRYGNTAYDAKTIAFQVVPKINAVGRMADTVNMNTMVQYLISDDDTSIRYYAKQVLSINQLRKDIGKNDAKHAETLIKDDSVHIVSSSEFHEGLLGIVANQIVTKTNVPAIVFKEKEEGFKGSARSNTLSLSKLFNQLDESYFLGFGGHDFAFGLTVRKEAFTSFKKDIQKIAPTLKSTTQTKKAIYCDFPITSEMISELLKLEPFGEGFDMPRFMIDGFEISDIKNLNGYGYKLIFKNYFLKDAVIFNPNLSQETIYSMKTITGTFDVHPRFGLSFSIEDFSV